MSPSQFAIAELLTTDVSSLTGFPRAKCITLLATTRMKALSDIT
jgi:hypothetical protein